MTNPMNITAEQVEKMLELHADAERRLERAIANKNDRRIDVLRAEALGMEKMLEAMGIEWC